ncbi:sodium/hydrogen exchanger 9B2-like isoform X1 [Aphis gossypii]|nr:sodium/hydrogen exchanger 9B2-like isoform X1 [Aphis gossypii]
MDKPLIGSGQINYLTMTSGEDGIIKGGRTTTSWTCRIHPLFNAITSVACMVMTWCVMYFFFDMTPNSQLASVVFLISCSWAGGKIAEMLYLPPLLGMLLAGVVLRNTGHYDVDQNIYQPHIINLREVALTVLLAASGLSLDPTMLKKLSLVVTQLAILPCITETIAAAVVTHYLLGLPWIWGLLLGCILSPVSSAVILPALLDFKQKGLGEDKGIITLVMAACSFDDIFCISAFGVCLSIIFSEGSWKANAMRGPMEVGIGVCVGIVWGLITGFIPHKCESSLTLKRTYIITAGGVLLTFGSKMIDLPGAGPLAIMTAAFVSAICWKKNNSFSDEVEVATNNVWDFLEPLLFASIGTEIDLSSIRPTLITSASVLLVITSLVRVVTCFFVLRDTNFNLREKIFVNIAWLPKATVQAAIGPIALDMARSRDERLIPYASDVLAISVLAILITAPIGAIIMTLRGEYLLRKQY